jgi:hypothetical protein
MKGQRCIWGCGGADHNYVCTPNPTPEHARSVQIGAEAFQLLREARTVIDTLNGNIQGQTEAGVRDPVTNAVCRDMIARIDALMR